MTAPVMIFIASASLAAVNPSATVELHSGGGAVAAHLVTAQAHSRDVGARLVTPATTTVGKKPTPTPTPKPTPTPTPTATVTPARTPPVPRTTTPPNHGNGPTSTPGTPKPPVAPPPPPKPVSPK